MKKRKVFLEGRRINIVEQEALLDAKPFLKSRSDETTLELIGERMRTFNLGNIFDEMQHREIVGNIFPNMAWTIVSKKDNHYVGDICLFPLENSYGIKLIIITEEQNQGYGTEAIKLLSDFLLMRPDINILYAQVYTNNYNAFRLFMNLGFHFCYIIDNNYRLSNGSKCLSYLLSKSI